MKEIVLIFFTFSLVTVRVTGDLFKIPTGLHQFASSDDVRIVGGNEAAPNSLPYQVALNLILESARSFCGGSLVTRRYVLTAAHCLYNGVVSVEVILGAHNISRIETTQQRIQTSNFKIHEEYNDNTVQNDVAVVYLPTPAVLNRYVQLIALPSGSDVSKSFVGSQGTTSGWGTTSDSPNDSTNVLRYVNVPIISNDVCRKAFEGLIMDSNICSGGAGGKGHCYGDSGGPLVVDRKLVGVVSFGSFKTCDSGDPSVYSRVTSFLKWIAANSDVVIS